MTDTESSRKKIKRTATFPDESGVIHNVRQKSYGSLTVRKHRYVGEIYIVDKDRLRNPPFVEFRAICVYILEFWRDNHVRDPVESCRVLSK